MFVLTGLVVLYPGDTSRKEGHVVIGPEFLEHLSATRQLSAIMETLTLGSLGVDQYPALICVANRDRIRGFEHSRMEFWWYRNEQLSIVQQSSWGGWHYPHDERKGRMSLLAA